MLKIGLWFFLLQMLITLGLDADWEALQVYVHGTLLPKIGKVVITCNSAPSTQYQGFVGKELGAMFNKLATMAEKEEVR